MDSTPTVLTFTAAQIAECLGVTPRAIRKSLGDVLPDGRCIVKGVEAVTWSFQNLPQSMRERLQDKASKRGYRSAEQMLADPPKRWKPTLPLHEIDAEEVQKALKLRDALVPWLLVQNDTTRSTAELEACGVADYHRVFGHRISGRYWRELLSRTLQRDNGDEDWARVELYLPDKPKPKKPPVLEVDAAKLEPFARIEDYINACSNPQNPSKIERRGIWTMAFDHFQSLVAQGSNESQAARLTRWFLSVKAPFLAPSRDALLKAFDRKLARLEAEKGDVKAIKDRREDNGNHFRLPEEDRDLLVHRAVFYYRGNVAAAWRDLLREGFSELIRNRYSNPSRKSYVPQSVMDSVSSEVEILTVMHQGARAFDSIKGYVERSYEGVYSLDGMVADDFTMPVYYYVPDGNGWYTLTRGQILIFQDVRTLRVLGWSIQPDRNYNSLVIRSLCTHVFAAHGVPNVLYFEGGIWQSATLIKGKNSGALEFNEVVHGLREFGIKFIHAIRPRTKTVERVGGMLQDLMEGEPGYCGRNERIDAPESLRKQMAEVTTRKTHPSEYFLSYSQWEKRFGEIVARYNAARQDGRILNGLSPDDAFYQFANVDDPPKQFGPELRYLLAHDKRVVTVTLNGITIRVGKQNFNYRSKSISHLVGYEVIAWFDPENPETLIVTDKNRRNPIAVERTQNPNVLETLVNPESERLGRAMAGVEDQASHLKARFNVLKAKYPMPQRKTLADAHTVQLGQQIDSHRSRVQESRERSRNLEVSNRAKARQLGVPQVLVGDDEQTRIALQMREEALREIEAESQQGKNT